MREAMQLLMDTVENDPTSALAWAGLAYGYGELGHSPFPEKELDPLSLFYSAWLVEQYRDAGMLDRAIDEAESALQLRENYPVANLVLGEVFADLGDFDKAIEYHQNLRKNYYWSFAVAATLGAAGRVDEAREIARKYEKKR